nr:MAG TPA: hypothetical protein [Caudoviricetes sp.]
MLTLTCMPSMGWMAVTPASGSLLSRILSPGSPLSLGLCGGPAPCWVGRSGLGGLWRSGSGLTLLTCLC